MKFMSIDSPDFVKSGADILNCNGELLVLLRFPYQAGNKAFQIIRTLPEYIKFLKERKEKESITLMKSFEYVVRGIVNETFIHKLNEKLDRTETMNWLIIWDSVSIEIGNSYFVNNKIDLRTELTDAMGQNVSIIVEPDWLDEQNSINAYVADKDGVVRPGAY